MTNLGTSSWTTWCWVGATGFTYISGLIWCWKVCVCSHEPSRCRQPVVRLSRTTRLLFGRLLAKHLDAIPNIVGTVLNAVVPCLRFVFSNLLG
jgi:hypothetical protein